MSYLIVNPKREPLAGIGHIGGIAEAVNRQAACKLLRNCIDVPQLEQKIHTDRRQEDFDISTRYQLVFVRKARACSSNVGVGRILPQDSCHQCTQRETFGESPHLRLVSIITKHKPNALARKRTDAKSLGNTG